MGNSVKGTEFKLNLHMQKCDGYSLKDVDFYVEVFTDRGGLVKIDKSECKEVDEDNFLVGVDSSKTGVGKYFVRLTAYIPDGDFPDGIRTEKKSIPTGITIESR